MLNRKGSYMQAALPLPIKNEDYSFEKRRSSSINQSIPGNGPRKSIFVRRNSYLSRKSSESNNNQLIQRFQPTYKMDIEEHEKFKPWLIEPKLEEVLEDALRGKVYNPSMSGMLCKELSQNILREIRSMPLVLSPRYKLIANVIIGQSGGISRLPFWLKILIYC